MPKPPPLPGLGRRKHPRVEIFAQVQLKRGTEIHILRVTNASLGGLFLEGPRTELPPLTPGTELDLDLFLGENTTADPISLAAKVVRIETGLPQSPIRFGVQILKVDAQSEERFQTVLKRAAADKAAGQDSGPTRVKGP